MLQYYTTNTIVTILYNYIYNYILFNKNKYENIINFLESFTILMRLVVRQLSHIKTLFCKQK